MKEKRLASALLAAGLLAAVLRLDAAAVSSDDIPPLEGRPLRFSDAYGPHAFKEEVVRYKTIDGADIEATVLASESKEAKPGLVFVPMWARDRETYWGLPQFLASHGYTSVTLDLRGHGKSLLPYPDQHVRITTTDVNRKYADNYMDVLPAIDLVNGRPGVLKDRVVLVGASLGSPLAVIAASKRKDKVLGMIHLAPGDYFDVRCEEALAEVGELPAFVIADRRDKAFQRQKAFFGALRGYKAFFPADGLGHGTNALYQDAGLPTLILHWLRELDVVTGVNTRSGARSAEPTAASNLSRPR